MAKTKEELNQLKAEYETLNNKLKELTEDELLEVTGGNFWNEDWGSEGKDSGDPGYYEPFV